MGCSGLAHLSHVRAPSPYKQRTRPFHSVRHRATASSSAVSATDCSVARNVRAALRCSSPLCSCNSPRYVLGAKGSARAWRMSGTKRRCGRPLRISSTSSWAPGSMWHCAAWGTCETGGAGEGGGGEGRSNLKGGGGQWERRLVPPCPSVVACSGQAPPCTIQA